MKRKTLFKVGLVLVGIGFGVGLYLKKKMEEDLLNDLDCDDIDIDGSKDEKETNEDIFVKEDSYTKYDANILNNYKGDEFDDNKDCFCVNVSLKDCDCTKSKDCCCGDGDESVNNEAKTLEQQNNLNNDIDLKCLKNKDDFFTKEDNEINSYKQQDLEDNFKKDDFVENLVNDSNSMSKTEVNDVNNTKEELVFVINENNVNEESTSKLSNVENDNLGKKDKVEETNIGIVEAKENIDVDVTTNVAINEVKEDENLSNQVVEINDDNKEKDIIEVKDDEIDKKEVLPIVETVLDDEKINENDVNTNIENNVGNNVDNCQETNVEQSKVSVDLDAKLIEEIKAKIIAQKEEIAKKRISLEELKDNGEISLRDYKELRKGLGQEEELLNQQLAQLKKQ